jgi:hypothetical protein
VREHDALTATIGADEGGTSKDELGFGRAEMSARRCPSNVDAERDPSKDEREPRAPGRRAHRERREDANGVGHPSDAHERRR